MFKRFLLLLFTTEICFFILATAFAADDLQAKEALTIKQAIEIALKNNPNIRVSSEVCLAGRTRIGQTQSAYYPQVNLQSRYSHSWNETGPSAGRDSYGSSFSLNQLIFDFGKTAALLGTAKENYKSLRESYKNTRQTIALNTKIAYYTCLAAQRELKLTGETIRQREQLLYQAKQYFKTGLKPKIDVTRAEANYYDAKLSFIRAQNMLKVAKINLMNALAVEKLPGDRLQDVLEIKKPILMDVAGAKSMAMEQRTELLQNRALERERGFTGKSKACSKKIRTGIE